MLVVKYQFHLVKHVYWLRDLRSDFDMGGALASSSVCPLNGFNQALDPDY